MLLLATSIQARAQESGVATVRSNSTLSFWFGDDDVLHANSASPAADIGDRPGFSALVDDRVARNTGRENQSELVLSLARPGFWPHVETALELRARVDWDGLLGRGSQAQPFEDASSFLRVSYLVREAPRWALSFTAYPIDADRVRLGYLRDLTWGGSDVGRDESVFPGLQGTAPAALVSFESPRVECWVGFKTARLREASPQGAPVEASNYGGLAGLSARAGFVRVEVELAGFEQGRFAAAVAPPVRRLVVGSSARMTVGDGTNSPRAPGLFLLNGLPLDSRWETVRRGWSISAEVSLLAQRLATGQGALALVPERAGAIVASTAWDGPWLAALAEYRDLMFVLRNAPGFIAGQTLPFGAHARPELSSAIELGYHFSALHLAPSVEFGARGPAAVVAADGRMLLVEGPHTYAPLANQRIQPVLAARAGLVIEASALLDSLSFIEYEFDDNLSQTNEALRHAPWRLGFGLGLRARF
jgi:hypothetical protein